MDDHSPQPFSIILWIIFLLTCLSNFVPLIHIFCSKKFIAQVNDRVFNVAFRLQEANSYKWIFEKYAAIYDKNTLSSRLLLSVVGTLYLIALIAVTGLSAYIICLMNNVSKEVFFNYYAHILFIIWSLLFIIIARFIFSKKKKFLSIIIVVIVSWSMLPPMNCLMLSLYNKLINGAFLYEMYPFPAMEKYDYVSDFGRYLSNMGLSKAIAISIIDFLLLITGSSLFKFFLIIATLIIVSISKVFISFFAFFTTKLSDHNEGAFKVLLMIIPPLLAVISGFLIYKFKYY